MWGQQRDWGRGLNSSSHGLGAGTRGWGRQVYACDAASVACMCVGTCRGEDCCTEGPLARGLLLLRGAHCAPPNQHSFNKPPCTDGSLVPVAQSQGAGAPGGVEGGPPLRSGAQNPGTLMARRAFAQTRQGGGRGHGANWRMLAEGGREGPVADAGSPGALPPLGPAGNRVKQKKRRRRQAAAAAAGSLTHDAVRLQQ